LVAHDLIGMNLIFDFFKKKKIKVVFGASGADELFGGYELYKKVNWASKKNINMSPYSSFIKTKNISKLEKYYNKIWIRAFNKYYKFTNKNEAKIQASLFVDYFGQSLDKDNISIDAMAGENSLEIRNMFINKETIKYAINLPIKYKLNLLNKNDLMKTKPILKNLFIKKFSKELVFKKQGFSGFPNETKRYLTKNECLELKKYQGRQKKTKENDWKNLNLFFFKKYLNY
jgi:asparagine synthetase B (glutamine-hydrolysing)